MSRVALICNLLFVACYVLQRIPDPGLSQGVIGIVALLGWMLPLFINFALVIAYLINAIRKRVMLVPSWLIITNVLFFIAQVLIQIVFA